MVAGAEQPDPVQHGIEVLVAVTDEPRAMPLPAIDALAPVPGVGASSCSSSEEPSRVIAVRIANSTATRSAPRIPAHRPRAQPAALPRR